MSSIFTFECRSALTIYCFIYFFHVLYCISAANLQLLSDYMDRPATWHFSGWLSLMETRVDRVCVMCVETHTLVAFIRIMSDGVDIREELRDSMENKMMTS